MIISFPPLLRLVILLIMTAAAHAGEYPFSVERIKLKGGEGVLAVNDGPLTVSATVDLARQINTASDISLNRPGN